VIPKAKNPYPFLYVSLPGCAHRVSSISTSLPRKLIFLVHLLRLTSDSGRFFGFPSAAAQDGPWTGLPFSIFTPPPLASAPTYWNTTLFYWYSVKWSKSYPGEKNASPLGTRNMSDPILPADQPPLYIRSYSIYRSTTFLCTIQRRSGGVHNRPESALTEDRRFWIEPLSPPFSNVIQLQPSQTLHYLGLNL